MVMVTAIMIIMTMISMMNSGTETAASYHKQRMTTYSLLHNEDTSPLPPVLLNAIVQTVVVER